MLYVLSWCLWCPEAYPTYWESKSHLRIFVCILFEFSLAYRLATLVFVERNYHIKSTCGPLGRCHTISFIPYLILHLNRPTQVSLFNQRLKWLP